LRKSIPPRFMGEEYRSAESRFNAILIIILVVITTTLV
jgi:hypothetical protein